MTRSRISWPRADLLLKLEDLSLKLEALLFERADKSLEPEGGNVGSPGSLVVRQVSGASPETKKPVRLSVPNGPIFSL